MCRNPAGSYSLSATAEPGLEEWLGFQPQRGRGRAFQAQGRICHTRVQVCSQDLSRELRKWGRGEDGDAGGPRVGKFLNCRWTASLANPTKIVWSQWWERAPEREFALNEGLQALHHWRKELFRSLVAEGKADSIQGRLPLWGFVVKERAGSTLNIVRKTGA